MFVQFQPRRKKRRLLRYVCSRPLVVGGAMAEAGASPCASRPLARSDTRKALSMGADVRSSTDNSSKLKATSESFHSLLTTGSTAEEKEALRRQYEAQADKYRKQIRRTRRCTLDPTGKWMSRWDAVTTISLGFVATVTPFEVCVLDGATTFEEMLSSPLAWINRVVDFIFITDVVFNCFLSYQDFSSGSAGNWVYDNQRILKRYARSWILIDVITAFPIDLVTTSVTTSEDEAPPEALQLVRMIRLVKLGRVIRASRIFKRWESYLGWSFSVIALIQFFCLVSFLAHWFACMWILVGRNSIGMLPDGVNGADWANDHAAFGKSWMERANLEDATPGQLYGVALYVALACIFSGSGGSIVPASPLEYYVQAFMMMLGSAVWAYVVANGVSILSTLNPHKVHYRNQMDQVRCRPIEVGTSAPLTLCC